MRPDVVIRHGTTDAIVSGDKAHEVVEAAGLVVTSTFVGLVVPLDELQRLRDCARARGWSLIEHEPARSS
jgi:threonine aldolase